MWWLRFCLQIKQIVYGCVMKLRRTLSNKSSWPAPTDVQLSKLPMPQWSVWMWCQNHCLWSLDRCICRKFFACLHYLQGLFLSLLPENQYIIIVTYFPWRVIDPILGPYCTNGIYFLVKVHHLYGPKRIVGCQ